MIAGILLVKQEAKASPESEDRGKDAQAFKRRYCPVESWRVGRRTDKEGVERLPSNTREMCESNLNSEIVVLSEVTQKEKDKYHMTSLICGT